MKAYKKIAKQGWNKDKKASNRKLRAYEEIEIAEQLEEKSSVGKAVKKKVSRSEKQIARDLSNLRFVFKFIKRHTPNVDISDLKKPDPKYSEWFNGIRQGYYQEYKKLIPEVSRALNRDDLPRKLRKQIIEVLQLFNINTEQYEEDEVHKCMCKTMEQCHVHGVGPDSEY